MREVSECGEVASVTDSCEQHKSLLSRVCGKSKLRTVLRIEHVLLGVTKVSY